MSRPVGSKNKKGAAPRKSSRAQLTFTEEDLVVVHLSLYHMRVLLALDPAEDEINFREIHERFKSRVEALIERVEYYL